MKRKLALTISIIVGAVCLLALMDTPSVRTGWILVGGLTASLIVTVHYLNRF